MPRILVIVSILGLAAGVALAQPAKRDQFERIPGPVVKIEDIRAGKMVILVDDADRGERL